MYDKTELEKLRADLQLQLDQLHSQTNQVIGAIQIINQMIEKLDAPKQDS